MSHLDPDDLALMALSPSSTTRAQRAHLEECADCSREEKALRHTAELGRSVDDAELMTPPPAAWTVIHRELGLTEAVAGHPVTPSPRPVLAPAPTSDATPTTDPTPAADPATLPSTEPSQRRRRVWPLLVAAVIVGIFGGFGASALSSVVGDRFAVVAEAVLDPLPGQQGTGNARVEVGANGQRDIVVTVGDGAVPTSPTDGTLREVWLLNSDASGLVSLGLLDGSSGRFVLPAGIDIDEYPLVDVSVEAADGDPAHSGTSVVRGQLRSS
jgi:hypothetical protein